MNSMSRICFCAVWPIAAASLVFGGELDLKSVDASRYRSQEYLVELRRTFDLNDESVSRQLLERARKPLTPYYRMKLATVLTANDTRGLLWVLNALHEDNVALKGNLAQALVHSEYREAVEVLVLLLEDTRSVPVTKIRGPKWEPPPPHFVDYRVCDLALTNLLQILGRVAHIPRKTRREYDVNRSNPLAHRDRRLAAFLDMWEIQGADILASMNALTTEILRKSNTKRVSE